MRFSQVSGQEKIKKGLRAAFGRGIVPHAQLFTGPPGSGAFTMALAYAQYLNCSDRREEDSCGICDSCKRMERLQHPDLHFSFPFLIAPKKENTDAYLSEWRELVRRKQAYFTHEEWVEAIQGESKNLLINVNEAASLSSKLWIKSFGGGYKFMIIFEPELMHESAANKLLKLIEEPPEKSVIILVSEKPENILLTIRSRAQLIKLQPLGDDLIANRIQNEYGLEAHYAKDLARIMNGNLARALSAAENGNINQWFSLFRDWMRVCYTADIMKLIPWVDQLNTFGREEQRNFLAYSVEVLRQCLTGNYTSGELQRFGHEELGFAKKFGPFINHSNGRELLEEFQQAYRDIRGNMNAKLVFFDLSIRVHKLLRKSKLRA